MSASNDLEGFAPDPELGQSVYDMDRAHVFHSWSAQSLLKPLTIAKAQGSYVWDYSGKRYLDLSSQLVNTNIGHQHPKVVAAIQAQAAKLCTIAPQHANDTRNQAAKRIAAVAPDGFEKVFFTNGGAEAVEYAVRMARLHTGKHKVLAAYRSYHGSTTTAINLTGDPRRWANDQGAAGVVHFFGPFLYRSVFYAKDEAEECARALAHLEQLIQFEGANTLAAVILESVPGTAGIMIPPPGYLKGVRALCDKYGLLFITDEVMAGFGRTGSWFAFQQHDVAPDLITFAKGVNSGYVPLGGVVISNKVAQTFAERVFPGGLTYSGHPLACAAAVATLDAMRDEGIVENAARLGAEVLGPGLREIAARHPSVGEVRGTGVFWCVELVKDRETREMLVPYNAAGAANAPMVELGAEMRRLGALPFMNFNRLHVVPPCNTSVAEAREGLAIVDEALKITDRYAKG